MSTATVVAPSLPPYLAPGDAAASLARRGKKALNQELDRSMVRLALPSMIENLLLLLLILTDTMMIAMWGGTAAVAATAAAGHILWRVQMTLGCVDRGTTALVARSVGEGRLDKAATALGQSILLAVFVGVVITALGLPTAGVLLRVIGTPPETAAIALPYLQILYLGTVPRMVAGVCFAAARAAGDTKTPMLICLGMNVFNVACNSLLIFGLPALPWLGFGGWPGWGMAGCAVATSLAHGLAGAAMLWMFASGRMPFRMAWPDLRFAPRTCLTIGRVSLPAMGEEAVMTVGFTMFFAFVSAMGADALAAHTISTRVEALAFMPAFGLSVAAATLVGQSLGMADPARAALAMRRCAWACTGFMVLAGLCLILFGEVVIRLFLSGSPDVELLARMLLIIAAVQQPLMGLVMVLGGGLRGAGDTLRPMMSSLAGNLVVRVGLCYLLAFPLGLGILGIYLGTMFDWLARSFVLTYFVQRGDWTKIRLG